MATDLWSITLNDIMSHRLTTVCDTDSVESVITLFDDQHISGAPVVDGNGKTVGVISRTNLSSGRFLALLKEGQKPAQIPVKELMHAGEVLSIEESATIVEAVRMMMEKKIHRVFVVNADQQMTGVFSSFDVLSLVDLLASQDH